MILLPGKLLLFHMQLLMYPKIKVFLAIGAVFIFFEFLFSLRKKQLLKHTAVIALAVLIAVVAISDFIERDNIYVKEINGYYTTSVCCIQ